MVKQDFFNNPCGCTTYYSVPLCYLVFIIPFMLYQWFLIFLQGQQVVQRPYHEIVTSMDPDYYHVRMDCLEGQKGGKRTYEDKLFDNSNWSYFPRFLSKFNGCLAGESNRCSKRFPCFPCDIETHNIFVEKDVTKGGFNQKYSSFLCRTCTLTQTSNEEKCNFKTDASYYTHSNDMTGGDWWIPGWFYGGAELDKSGPWCWKVHTDNFDPDASLSCNKGDTCRRRLSIEPCEKCCTPPNTISIIGDDPTYKAVPLTT